MIRFPKRLLSDGGWVAFGSIGAALGQLVGIRILTEVVRPEIFGGITLLLGATALVFGTFFGPLMQAVLRYYPEMAKTGVTYVLRSTASVLFYTRVRLASLLIIVISCIYIFWENESGLIALVLVGLVFIDAIRSFEMTMFNAARRHQVYALWQVAEAWGRPAFIVLLVMWAGASAQNVLIAYLIASSIITLFVMLVIKREGVINEKKQEYYSSDLSVRLRAYMIPLLPIGIIGWISGISDRYIVGGLLGLDKVGIYAAVYGLASRPMLMISGIAESVIRPIYYNALASRDPEAEKQLIYGWILLITIAGVFIFLIVIAWHKDIAKLLLGSDYRSGSSLMPWIVGGYTFLALSHITTRICHAYNNTRWVLGIEAAGAILSIVVAIPFTYYLGIKGAAAAVPIYFIIQLMISIFAAARCKAKASLLTGTVLPSSNGNK